MQVVNCHLEGHPMRSLARVKQVLLRAALRQDCDLACDFVLRSALFRPPVIPWLGLCFGVLWRTNVIWGAQW